MDVEELRVIPASYTSEELEEIKKRTQLLFQFNHTMPMTNEYITIMHQLFCNGLGEGSMVIAPVQGICLDRVKIGKNVYINSNALMMARGGITIEDDVMVAANVSFLTNNHDPYDRKVLLCKPIVIKKGAWLGANATILPGVMIGKYAIVGAASVVTRDIPDYAVVVGSPAKIIQMLDPTKFDD